MSFFSYRDLCGSPTFALSLQRLSSNHKKKNEMKNLIAFFEIPSTDFRRAVDFYETVGNQTFCICMRKGKNGVF